MLATVVSHSISGWAIVAALIVLLVAVVLEHVAPVIPWVLYTICFVTALTLFGLFVKF